MAPLIMLFNSTATTNCSSSVQTKETYDATGAASFIVVTVVVYGLGIMAFIAGHIQKRNVNREEETHISRYLKNGNFIVSAAKKQTAVQQARNLLTSVSFADSNYSRRCSEADSCFTSDLYDQSVNSCDGDTPPIGEDGNTRKVRFSISSVKTPLIRENSKEYNDISPTSVKDDVFT